MKTRSARPSSIDLLMQCALTALCLVVLASIFLTATPANAQQPGGNPCNDQVNQTNINQCAWNTFSSNISNNVWANWSSTSDLLDPTTPGAFGTRYIPPACQTLAAANPGMRVLSQVGKVSDSVYEAGTGSHFLDTYTWSGTGKRSDPVGLSNDPVIAANGSFIRYEIIMNAIAYNWIVDNQFYKASTLESWSGDLVFPLGSTVLKNVWMDLGSLNAGNFHTQRFLVYTAGELNQNQMPSCELKTMALVGEHLVTKSNDQPAWTWATIEHKYSAPECTADLPSSGVNMSCPTTAEKQSGLMGSGLNDYLLNPTACSGNSCSACNTAPAKNCTIPAAPNSYALVGSYCVDQPPAPNRGMTQACRQVSQSVLGTPASLSDDNYMLISTQWYDDSSLTGDINVAPTVRPSTNGNRTKIKPPTAQISSTSPGVSVLGNSTMETYERSNCIGCHSSSVFKQNNTSQTQISTDFMFFLTVEVPCGANGNVAACMD